MVFNCKLQGLGVFHRLLFNTESTEDAEDTEGLKIGSTFIGKIDIKERLYFELFTLY